MIKLYHGTTCVFDVILLSEGKGYKDFGKGFYATAEEKHAERLAIRNREIQNKRQSVLKTRNSSSATDPVVAYRYNLIFDEQVGDLKVKNFLEADGEWLKFIIANRTSPFSAHDYDIVIGPTADAQTTTIINEYISELKSTNYNREICDKVIAELMPENLPKQYFFGTEESLKTLKFDKIIRQEVL